MYTYAAISVVILLQGGHLNTVSRWAVILDVVYILCPPRISAEIPLSILANIVSITVAIAVTVVVALSPSLLKQAIDENGIIPVYSVHIAMHYIPPIINVIHLRRLVWPHLADISRLDPMSQMTTAVLSAAVLASVYSIFMHPKDTYSFPSNTLTLVSMMAVIVSASACLLSLIFFGFARYDKWTRTLSSSLAQPAPGSSNPSA